MISFYKTAIFLLVASNAAFGQITYQNEDYSLIIGSNMEEKTSEDFRFVTPEFIYTNSTISQLTKKYFFGIYNRSDFSLVKRIENDGNWKKDGFELEADTIVNNADGSFRFISKCYDKKKSLLKFYSINFTKEGEQKDINLLVDIALNDELDNAIRYIKTSENFVITVLADSKSDKNMQIHAVILDNLFEIKEHISGKLNSKSNRIQSVVFNEKNNSIVVCTRSFNKSIGTVPLPSTWQLYGLDLNGQSIVNTQLDLDFDFSSGNLFVNPNTHETILVSLVGEKNSMQIGATAYIKISSQDFSIEQVKLVPISEESVQKLSQAKSGYDKMWEGATSVSFGFKDIFFLKDGTLYTVFEDDYGQYILLTDSDYNIKWQTFNPVVRGFGDSKITLKENNLEVICYSISSWMEKAYPGYKMLADAKYFYDRCLVKFLISPAKTNLDIILTFSFKELKYYSMSFEEIEGEEDPSITFINAMHGNVLNGKTRAFMSIGDKK